MMLAAFLAGAREGWASPAMMLVWSSFASFGIGGVLLLASTVMNVVARFHEGVDEAARARAERTCRRTGALAVLFALVGFLFMAAWTVTMVVRTFPLLAG